MIDHNLYTKYLETRRLTFTKHLLYYNTIVLYKSTQHNISLWLSYHSPFPSAILSWMDVMAREGVSIYRPKGDTVFRQVSPSREFLNITFSKFIYYYF